MVVLFVYDLLTSLCRPDVDTEQAVHTQQQQGTTEHELQQPESHAMEDKNAAHTHRQQNAAQTSPSVPQLNGQPACQPCSSKDKTRRRYTSEQLLQLQQNLPQFSLGEDTSSSKQAHQADQQPGPSQITRDQQQGQQDSQWQWDPAHFWTADTGNAYGYQQGSAVPGTMGNAGTAGCQYGSAAAAPQATYMMPPPPPPPSASWWPTASSQPHTTNGWQAAGEVLQHSHAPSHDPTADIPTLVSVSAHQNLAQCAQSQHVGVRFSCFVMTSLFRRCKRTYKLLSSPSVRNGCIAVS